MNRPTFTALLFLALAGKATATDLGVQGTLWPIVERDMRQMLVESAARVDWSTVQDQVKDSANRYLENLPKRHIPSPEKTTTTWLNPSVTLNSDIQIPVKQADGSYAWRVLAPKGTVVNPLEQFRPVTAMLLFDGGNEDQLKMVVEVLRREPLRVVPVEAGTGDLRKQTEALSRPVFYASDAMLQRFKIRYLPTLVYPGTGAQEMLLGVTSFAAPYPKDEVLATWPALRQMGTAKDKGAK